MADQPTAPPPSSASTSSPGPTPIPERSGPRGELILGAILVVLGAILFIGQASGITIDRLPWPLWVIVPGAALLLAGLLFIREEGVLVGGTVATSVGLLLLYQDSTDHWESWAYAWALVGPAASGFGMLLWGVRSGDGGAVRRGTWAMLGGLAIFAIGFLFFEGMIGISGRRLDLPEWLLPALVIGVGLVMVVRGFIERPDADAAS